MKFKERPVAVGSMISFKTSAPSGHFDAHRVARVLYKAALGALIFMDSNIRYKCNVELCR